MTTTRPASPQICDACGIPLDSDYFDEVGEADLQLRAMLVGDERLLARFTLPDRYCGVLTGFAQLTDRLQTNGEFATPGLRWLIRSNGRLLAPYQDISMIINPWEHGGYGVSIRLDENATIEIAVQRTAGLPPPPVGAPDPAITRVAARIAGRYWYNPAYGARDPF